MFTLNSSMPRKLKRFIQSCTYRKEVNSANPDLRYTHLMKGINDHPIIRATNGCLMVRVVFPKQVCTSDEGFYKLVGESFIKIPDSHIQGSFPNDEIIVNAVFAHTKEIQTTQDLICYFRAQKIFIDFLRFATPLRGILDLQAKAKSGNLVICAYCKKRKCVRLYLREKDADINLYVKEFVPPKT